MNQIHFRNQIFEKVWQIFLALYCFSVLTSKSGVSIFGIILILFSLFIIPWSHFFKERKEVIGVIALYPLAAVVSLFSLGGSAAAFKILYSWPWPLLALPAYVVFVRPKDYKVVAWSFITGFIMACFFSYFLFLTEYHGQFNDQTRVASFWDVSRWAVFLSSTLIGLLALSLYLKSKHQRLYRGTQILIFLLMISFLLSNARAPWIGAALGVFLFCCLFPRIIKFLVLVVLLVGISLSLSPGIRERAFSILNVQKNTQGHVSSTDPSNESRLRMWRASLELYKDQPWFGTGFGNSSISFKNYFEAHPENQEIFLTPNFSFSDQHSSYFSLLVQVGLLFSVVFWVLYIILGVQMFKNWYQSRSLWAGSVVCLMAVHSVIFIFYSSVMSYEMLALLPFIALRPKKTLT